MKMQNTLKIFYLIGGLILLIAFATRQYNSRQNKNTSNYAYSRVYKQAKVNCVCKVTLEQLNDTLNVGIICIANDLIKDKTQTHFLMSDSAYVQGVNYAERWLNQFHTECDRFYHFKEKK